ncbi:MAG TPA: ABC transporter permease [Alphaproteobacteria bacterium]|nr:ABC transporter permease [Alphaproteobacteria bacterium]
MPGSFSLLLDIALAHLSGRRRQTIVATAGVAMGVGFFIAMAAMMQGFQSYFVQTVIDVSPHIVISDEYRDLPRQPLTWVFDPAVSALSVAGIKPKREIRGIRNAGRILRSLADTPGVRVAPMLEGPIIYRYGTTDKAATLNGIDPDAERHITEIESDMTFGSLDNLKTYANGIVVGAGLARDLGAAYGDTLTAVSPAGVVRNMKIVGIFRSGVTALDNRVSYTLLKRAQVLQDRPNVINAIRLRLNDPHVARSVAADIERRVAYKAVSWQEANQGFMAVFVIQNVIIYSTTAAILIVACFGIFNIVSTIVNEKARDIAILKSMGFSEGDIQSVFVFQGFVMGVCGAVAGWALGYAMSRGLGEVRVNIESELSIERLSIIYTWVHYAIGGGVCVAAAALAAWLPARRAARLRPVDILRGAA